MNKTLGVAIASFNGMRYIEHQLESISRQTDPPELISISDDCSTDGTFEFLQNFQRRSKIPVILSTNKSRLGVIENFMAAFRNCEADYIAYCDQDDLWAEDKIAVCKKVLASRDLALLFHRSTIVDSDLKPSGRFAPNNMRRGVYRFPHFPDNLWGFGHQMIFSRQVFEVMSQIKESSSPTIAFMGTCFDLSLLVAAGMVGDIYFVDQELMKFRRHNDTASPAGKIIAKGSDEDLVDSRKAKIASASERLESILGEIETGGLRPAQDPDLMKAYIEHIRLLSNRYKRRRIVYESKSLGQRLQAWLELVLSNSYGSVRGNKLSGRQLLVDGWRSVNGEKSLEERSGADSGAAY